MAGRRRTSRLHAAMRDTHCPVCGDRIYKTHTCRGHRPAPLTGAELAAAAAACYDAIKRAKAADLDESAQLALLELEGDS